MDRKFPKEHIHYLFYTPILVGLDILKVQSATGLSMLELSSTTGQDILEPPENDA